MFGKAITRTALSSAPAEVYFDGRIYGDSYLNDNSFVSTMRALLDPRMGEGESVYLSFGSSSYSVADLGASKRAAMDATVGSYLKNDSGVGRIRIHDFRNSDKDANVQWIDKISSYISSDYPDWCLVEKVSLFFHKVFHVVCYINPEQKSVLVLAEHLDVRKLHYLQCGILAFFPWYFNQEAGVTELEMRLIESLRQKDSGEYETVIKMIADRYDFRMERIKQLLTGFEDRFERVKLSQCENDISRCRRQIESLQAQIRDQLMAKHEKETMYAGILAKLNESNGESEIMEYFLCNKSIEPVDVFDDELQFVASGYITYFEEDLARTIIRNHGSILYQYCGRSFTVDDLEKLYTAIFLEQKIKIRVFAAYKLRMHCEGSGIKNYNYPAHGFFNGTPNPHIDYYNCLGDHLRVINDCIINNDYIGAIEQCVASARSLNLGDAPVMRRFMERFLNVGDTYERCLELPDGSVVTPKQAIEYLKKEEESNV